MAHLVIRRVQKSVLLNETRRVFASQSQCDGVLPQARSKTAVIGGEPNSMARILRINNLSLGYPPTGATNSAKRQTFFDNRYYPSATLGLCLRKIKGLKKTQDLKKKKDLSHIPRQDSFG